LAAVPVCVLGAAFDVDEAGLVVEGLEEVC
jgi:hypothetical protein